MSRFTENQRRAIEARGNVLVVAGAGTGKTRTLVQRCVDWLRRGPGQNSLDQVLMVTFTEAAAAEMRQRIREELKQQLDREPGNSHLVEQLALLDTAFISTLHSFCFHLVRQHFYELALDPQLAVLPAEEAHLLAGETLSALLEIHYAGKTDRAQAVQRLIQDQARGRDLPVRRLILRLHHYTQTLPDPEGWFRDQMHLFSAAEPKAWRQWLRAALPGWINQWLTALQALGTDNPNVNACLAALLAIPPQPDLAQAHRALQQIKAAYDQTWPRGSAGAVRDRIKDFFVEADFLRGLTGSCPLSPELSPTEEAEWTDELRQAAASEDPMVQDWCWTKSQMLTLLGLTAEFGDHFAQAKREQGVVDFHDLEQFSLRLLWDRAKQSPTPLAEHWRRKLRLVFVDEYQDINAAQDAVLRALGGTGAAANRFLVGDPKQSIYRFRLADPHIFQAYTAGWQRDPSQGQVIPLTDNFRSREDILRFVNALFAQVMTPEIGGVPYDETAWLRFGDPQHRRELASARPQDAPALPAEPRLLPPVEFHLRLTSKEPGEDPPDEALDANGPWSSLSNTEKEACLVGLRLAELRAQRALIWDAETRRQRPVEWRDMVVLLRSPQRKVEGYAKEFCRLGIPLLATRSGFFDALEVSDLLNLLTLLDNPLQDLPLLAVLRSPLVALSSDELAIIRLAAPGRYWIALQHFRDSAARQPAVSAGAPQTVGPNTPTPSKLDNVLRDPLLCPIAHAAWDKADLFLRRFAEWRRLAREASLSQCLDRILSETQFCALLLAQPRGQQQRGNVLKLLTWARQFDQFQRQGLYRFLKFIEAQKEAGIDHEPAPLDTEQAVRLMSIHQSKGLEFGVVVIADLGKPFNLTDLKADIILDEQFGLCPLVKPPGTQQRYPSLPYWLAQRRQRRETFGEEMRLLYVAMTRACQCLILAGTATRSAAERWPQKTLASPRELLAARGYLDWIGPWISLATACPDWTQRPSGQTDLLRWVIYGQDDLPTPAPAFATENAEKTIAASPEDEKLAKALVNRLTWRYPFQVAVRQPAKLSVSALRQGILAQVDDETEEVQGRGPRLLPGFPEKRLSAAAVGIAHHTFLQFVSLDQVHDVTLLEAEGQRLERAKILSSEERSALDFKAIAAFWGSRIGQDILQQQSSLQRELPFTARLSLEDLQGFNTAEIAALQKGVSAAENSLEPTQETMKQEFVIVTGVVDLAVLLPQEIWLLDFKTDAVTADEWPDKARAYAPQLKLYQLALSRIYARPITRAWLHSLPLRQTLLCSG